MLLIVGEMVFIRGRAKCIEEYLNINKEKLFKIAYMYLKNKEDGFNLLIDNLNEELRLIIVLKYFHGYKIKEISEKCYI